ncbi:MAG TPA: hypothetical protein VKE74_03670 [Gemmataceae bacterium]|nr:hypothetical protein [Gemmataceae bacterium]
MKGFDLALVLREPDLLRRESRSAGMEWARSEATSDMLERLIRTVWSSSSPDHRPGPGESIGAWLYRVIFHKPPEQAAENNQDRVGEYWRRVLSDGGLPKSADDVTVMEGFVEGAADFFLRQASDNVGEVLMNVFFPW